MVSQMAAPQTDAKRYWGDEKNIDSIYSIYIKKICYTHNNDTSIYASAKGGDSPLSSTPTNSQENRNKRASSSNYKHSISINDMARLSIHDKQVENCQKKQETPRSRKNFFQKYRRRSCSMDKYSFEKAHKGSELVMTETPTSKSKTTTRHGSLTGSTKTKNDPRSSTTDNNANTPAKVNSSNYKSMNDISMQAQSLLWETRQIRILQAATLDHILKLILLINSNQNKETQNFNSSTTSDVVESTTNSSTVSSTGDDGALDEERNNVAHIIHVFFCTYRIYTNPYELMLKLMLYSDICRLEQYRFVMFYWMENYPEDFSYSIEKPDVQQKETIGANIQQVTDASINSLSNTSVIEPSTHSYHNSITSYDSLSTGKTNATSATTDSETNRTSIASTNSNKDQTEKIGIPLVSELLRLNQDEHVKRRAFKLNELRQGPSSTSGSLDSAASDSIGRFRSTSSRHHHHNNSKNSAVLDLDSRYVAQQLTAIDLDNFLSLRPYSLLDGSKSDKRIQSMIKNFNLLSRHVVVTILKSHNPNIVAAHWIAIAMNLRKIKNFNSLKAIIAGLTNESIYRLKQLVWNKVDRISTANFKLLASIVDDVNNQIVLRQTQLIVEGTAKMSIEDDSFGTIPYLGTFLTDLNMIDARYQSYVPSPKDETLKLKLINFEKCSKQFEILTQVQLLQKNVLASLHALQRRNNFDEQTTLNRLKLEQFSQSQQMLSAKPVLPKVSRLFENWFFDDNISSMTDKQCYEISVTMESNANQR